MGDVAQPFYDALDAYLKSRGVIYFRAKEVCNLDRKVWKGGEAAQMQPAPKGLWPNIIPTLRRLDWLRAKIDEPIYVTSGYRPIDYNRLVGSTDDSLHVAFNAVDFRARNTTPLRLALMLNRNDCSDEFGIGWYAVENFVHLDTRAYLGREAPARWPLEPVWWE